MKLYYWIFLGFMILSVSCKGSKMTASELESLIPEATEIHPTTSFSGLQAAPPTIVYKTTDDFYDNVPLIMDAQREEIVSYPAPSDLYFDGKLAKPTPLKNGYLLDNRGINANVVFLSYTYEEYSRFATTPSLDELKANILSKYPLQEMISCGSRYQYTDIEKEMNQLIGNGFPGCKIMYSASSETIDHLK